jgi:hypothetical protein
MIVAVGRFDRCFPCRTHVFLFLVSPRKRNQKEGDPAAPPIGLRPLGPLRCSPGRAAAELGPVGLRQSSPTSPGPLALLGGVEGGRAKPIAGWNDGGRNDDELTDRYDSATAVTLCAFPALHAAEQRRRWRKKGEDCLRPAGPSSAAPARAE